MGVQAHGAADLVDRVRGGDLHLEVGGPSATSWKECSPSRVQPRLSARIAEISAAARFASMPVPVSTMTLNRRRSLPLPITAPEDFAVPNSPVAVGREPGRGGLEVAEMASGGGGVAWAERVVPPSSSRNANTTPATRAAPAASATATFRGRALRVVRPRRLGGEVDGPGACAVEVMGALPGDVSVVCSPGETCGEGDRLGLVPCCARGHTGGAQPHATSCPGLRYAPSLKCAPRGVRFRAPDWRPEQPLWHTNQVARLSADAARLPPGGPEASPTVLVAPDQGRKYGNLPGSVSGAPARRPVGDFLPQQPPSPGISVRRFMEGLRHARPRGSEVRWRRGTNAIGSQSVTRDRTTK
ncbi:hypothetical protein Lal_00002658 [Lupinus albus]|nr:hypothetical protein Lal_00002658 [Lupinus albus]